MQKTQTETLALFGGEPIRKHPWPKWPQGDALTEQYLLDVLYSGRWTIDGQYNGEKLYERRFSEAFASYNGVPYCVSTTSGSSGLMLALEVLGVGYGDEVLVPGMTWVACASAVAAIGAVPILVDIDLDTLCMSIRFARKAITPQTKAIMLVHLYCTVADLDAFTALSEETGIPLIEDCAQAHGSKWRGQRVGTFGRVGVFSFQDSKVLTSGEGGAVITKDPQLYDLLQQLRTDGRRYLSTPPAIGGLELEVVGTIQGYNKCPSEFQSAVLLGQLARLDAENKLREQNAEYLRSLLSGLGGITPLQRSPQIDELTYYQFGMRVDLAMFGGVKLKTLLQTLRKEIGDDYIDPLYDPLNNNPLYNPLLSRRLSITDRATGRWDPKRFDLPNATKARQECLVMPHQVLLGDAKDMEDIAGAFEKVKRHWQALREWEQVQ